MEQLVTIIIIAIVLGADSFSLALGMALQGVSRSYELKFAGTVGIFHVMMPLVGLGLGITAGKLLGIWAARLGALVLIGLGVDMLLKGYHEFHPPACKLSEAGNWFNQERKAGSENWAGILVMATSVSIDALTVGFSLGTVKMPIVWTVTLIGTGAAGMTLLGFEGGRIFGRLMGSYARMAGGVILVLVALKMVI